MLTYIFLKTIFVFFKDDDIIARQKSFLCYNININENYESTMTPATEQVEGSVFFCSKYAAALKNIQAVIFLAGYNASFI